MRGHSTYVSILLKIIADMVIIRYYFFTVLFFSMLLMHQPLNAAGPAVAAIGLAPDPGFPAWLTPDIDNYLPLKTSQTSGLDWIASDIDSSGNPRVWFVMCDDAFEGGIHLVSIVDVQGQPEIHFHRSNLTLPPPDITRIPVEPGHGYDWEGIAIHPWSNTIFLSQEGSLEEIAIYSGSITPGDVVPTDQPYGRAGEVDFLPGHIANVRAFDPPGFEATFSHLFYENLGIEGISCSEDRLFMALESPCDFATRIGNEKSTVLGVWQIDPANPLNLDKCSLLKIIDTAEWEATLGCKIETICGLDSIDSRHLIGIDRDNQLLFAVEFTEDYELRTGRIFFLDVPGPAPLEIDGCPELENLPQLMKPSLESVAVVPVYDPNGEMVLEYQVYLAVDPWAPGWTLNEPGWECEEYVQKLYDLLPAVYRYTIPADMLFTD